jgi:hypothetical protein
LLRFDKLIILRKLVRLQDFFFVIFEFVVTQLGLGNGWPSMDFCLELLWLTVLYDGITPCCRHCLLFGHYFLTLFHFFNIVEFFGIYFLKSFLEIDDLNLGRLFDLRPVEEDHSFLFFFLDGLEKFDQPGFFLAVICPFSVLRNHIERTTVLKTGHCAVSVDSPCFFG